METSDFLVIGGGIVGAACAYGLARKGIAVTMLDGGDGDLRAARANFGLVWVQGKGLEMPEYQRWSRRSADLWPAFADELAATSGQTVDYRKPGGLVFCLGDRELEDRRQLLRRMHNQSAPGEIHGQILDRRELEQLLPGVRLGRRVTGASYGPHDGHANPLLLLRALHTAVRRAGGAIHPGQTVRRLRYNGGIFVAEADGARFAAPQVLIAAGHGARVLAEHVGLTIPIRPERGQILVTERCHPMLPIPASGLRQTEEGTFMIGATKEDVGLDTSTAIAPAAQIARRAVAILPALETARIVRNWSGLRVLTPDGCPVYAQSEVFPGVFVAACHSGVTLAALHAHDLADALAEGRLSEKFTPFHPRRFDVPQVA